MLLTNETPTEPERARSLAWEKQTIRTLNILRQNQRNTQKVIPPISTS